MLTGNASAVSAKELYDARHVCTDVEAGGLDAAVQDAVRQKVIEYNAKDLEVVTRWGAEDATRRTRKEITRLLFQSSILRYFIVFRQKLMSTSSFRLRWRRMRNTFQ